MTFFSAISKNPMSLLMALVLFLCLVLSFYFLYYFPRTELGPVYLYLVLAALILYPAGVILEFGGSAQGDSRRGIYGLLLMTVSMLLLACSQWQFFFLIFVAPFAAMLRGYCSLLLTLMLAVAMHVLLASVFYLRWKFADIFMQTPLYMVFTLSCIVLTHLLIMENETASRLATLHEQLLAAQRLLMSNAIDKERLRISRDLHDSLGHHLTALSLQLELASHNAGDKVAEPIEKATAITKLLLAQVRDVVGTLRTESAIDIRQSLEHLAAGTKGRITLSIAEHFAVYRPEVEEAIFRIVQEILTNHARHAQGSCLFIQLDETENEWEISARDDSKEAVSIVPNSGLLGMTERVASVGGVMELKAESGLSHLIRIPKAESL